MTAAEKEVGYNELSSSSLSLDPTIQMLYFYVKVIGNNIDFPSFQELSECAS